MNVYTVRDGHTRVVMPDLHIPFQDTKLLAAWFDFVEETEPDGIDVIGDLLDCYSLSRFDKNPERKNSFKDEVGWAWMTLAEMRERAPQAEICYSEGNHEERLRRLLWGNAKALAGLKGLSMPELLELDNVGAIWYPMGQPYKINDLWFMHGDIIRKHAGNTARAQSDKTDGSVLIGHTHRMGYVPTSGWERVRDAYEVGHLTDVSQMEYITGVPNWQQGWAVVTFSKGTHHVDFVRVVERGNKRDIWFRGKIWRTI